MHWKLYIILTSVSLPMHYYFILNYSSFLNACKCNFLRSSANHAIATKHESFSIDQGRTSVMKKSEKYIQTIGASDG